MACTRWKRRLRSRGFTLLELLVVIALLVVVIAILLSYLNRARETADRVHCRKTLRAIGQALLLYANENKGSFPRTGYAPGAAVTFSDDTSDGGTPRDPFGREDAPGKVADNDVTAAIFLLVRTQDITSTVFLCPSAGGEPDTFGTAAGAHSHCKTSFSNWRKNLGYSFHNPYPDEEAVKRGAKWDSGLSADFAVAADMNPGVGGGYDVTLATETSSARDMRRGNSRNHRREGQNVLYGDGHVDWQVTPFVGSKRDNIYTVAGIVNGEPATTSKTVVGSPSWAGDSVLLPAMK
jgi:prepilin-type N-terminal cleavage/methylation domain-containing protein/prepilin-type processing-associated H-X9-DG protein